MEESSAGEESYFFSGVSFATCTVLQASIILMRASSTFPPASFTLLTASFLFVDSYQTLFESNLLASLAFLWKEWTYQNSSCFSYAIRFQA